MNTVLISRRIPARYGVGISDHRAFVQVRVGKIAKCHQKQILFQFATATLIAAGMVHDNYDLADSHLLPAPLRKMKPISSLLANNYLHHGAPGAKFAAWHDSQPQRVGPHGIQERSLSHFDSSRVLEERGFESLPVDSLAMDTPSAFHTTSPKAVRPIGLCLQDRSCPFAECTSEYSGNGIISYCCDAGSHCEYFGTKHGFIATLSIAPKMVRKGIALTCFFLMSRQTARQPRSTGTGPSAPATLPASHSRVIFPREVSAHLPSAQLPPGCWHRLRHFSKDVCD
jgi:hypothetical protein